MPENMTTTLQAPHVDGDLPLSLTQRQRMQTMAESVVALQERVSGLEDEIKEMSKQRDHLLNFVKWAGANADDVGPERVRNMADEYLEWAKEVF